VRPAEAWPRLADRVAYFHIKDAILGTGQVVPAGEGDGALAETLRDAIRQRGYEGYLSLEPHLAAAGKFSGFSGPDLFKQAVRALKRILNEIGAAYS
jgi:sugar phosphate isomerase/epimerase